MFVSLLQYSHLLYIIEMKFQCHLLTLETDLKPEVFCFASLAVGLLEAAFFTSRQSFLALSLKHNLLLSTICFKKFIL